MLAVYLPNKTTGAAIKAASDVERFIDKELPCPCCGSTELYYCRKSDAGSHWMEVKPKCGSCGTSFSIPDVVLEGIWRNLNEEPIKTFKLKGELVEV